MDELNQKKNSPAPFIAVAVVAVLIGLGGYAYMKAKSAETTPPPATEETAATETPAVETPATPTEPTQAEEVANALPKTEAPKPDFVFPSATLANEKIKTLMGERSLGEATAPTKIIEFSSLTCPHCAAFHKETFDKFKTEFVDTGKVQLIFKEFPLNKPALDASMILRCMPADKYVSFMSLLFQEQEKWAYNEKYLDVLRQNAKLGGMSDAEFDTCLANKDLQEAIITDMKAGSDNYNVKSTPSFAIINGKVLVGNQPLSAFEEAIIGASAVSTPAPVTAAPEATTPEAAPAEATPPAEPAAPAVDEPAPPAE